MAFPTIYYLNTNMKNKGIGRYNGGELTCQDENPDKASIRPPYNFGFDNKEADFLYEAKD